MGIVLNIWRVLMLVLILAIAITGLAEQAIALPIAGACLILMLFYMIGAFISRYLPYSWACNWAGTHFPLESTSFDGCSMHSKCRKCSADIMLDGQGNWF